MAGTASSVTVIRSDDVGIPHRSLLAAIASSPVLWGGAFAWLFYASVPFLPVGRESLQRYFCSHPLEYALVGLSCIGFAILAQRLFNLHGERRSIAATSLPQGLDDNDLAARIDAVEQIVKQAPRYRSTMLYQRLRETCGYLKGAHSSSGLESHLKHLSETAADRLHDSYSLLLTINWAVPIIGFLGTVIGITLAIANVTPEQLDTSLNSVTGGLAVAFDTTTVAMSFSLVLVFAYDWMKRSEQRILSTVDDIALRSVLPFFASTAEESDPLLRAQADAARQLIEQTDVLVHEQTRLWRDSVDGLRERWNETLVDQQQQLAAGLNSGVEATLGEHSAQLHQMRQEFVSAFDRVSEHFTRALEQDRQARDERESIGQQRFEETWGRVRDDLQSVVRSHDAHTENVVDGLTERLQQWQSSLEQSSETVESQLQKLQELTDSMLRLADQEQQLIRVERQLSENLDAVQAAETFEQTLHNLTAAVHLLTARAKPRAA